MLQIYISELKKKIVYLNFVASSVMKIATAAVAQWVRVLALLSEGCVFESQPRQTLVVKTGSDSSTAKRSAIGVSVTGPRR